MVTVPPEAIDLQGAHGNRSFALGIATAWKAMSEAERTATLFEIDGERLDTDELRTLVDGWRHWLRARAADHPIGFGARHSGAEVPVAIAAWLEGRETRIDARDRTLRLENGQPLDLAGEGLEAYWAAVAPHLDSPPPVSNGHDRCALERTASRLRWLSGSVPTLASL